MGKYIADESIDIMTSVGGIYQIKCILIILTGQAGHAQIYSTFCFDCQKNTLFGVLNSYIFCARLIRDELSYFLSINGPIHIALHIENNYCVRHLVKRVTGN